MRIIAHLDMDAFFAAVEERDHPALRGMPMAVGADPKEGRGRGVVSTANYPAREYGIESATPISKAWRLSEEAKRKGKPAVIFLQPDFRKYEPISKNVIAIVKNFSSPLGKVEPSSIDEAYCDLSFCGSYEKAQKVCENIKREIYEKEQLTCSIGIGPNKLIAKIASGMHKPDGLTAIRAEEAENFLEPLLIRKIPGIGPKTEMKFYAKGVRLVRDLKKFSRETLHEMLGKWGSELYDRIRGNDDSPLVTEWIPKSISEQETFDEDTLKSEFLFPRLKKLCERVFFRFQEEGFESFRTLGITVRFYDFETKTRSRTLPSPSNSLQTLAMETLKLFLPFLDRRENPKKKLIRLLGVKIEKLS